MTSDHRALEADEPAREPLFRDLFAERQPHTVKRASVAAVAGQ